MIAILLSILFPGLGQIYYGKNARGILMVLLALVPFLYPFILIWSIVDVIKLNKLGLTPQFDKKEAAWAIVLFFIIIPLAFFLLVSGTLLSINYYSDNYVLPRENLKEGNKITVAIQNYYENKGHYPENISILAKRNPLRARWKTDARGEPYVYKFNNESKTFSLISKGKDKVLGTEDDFIFK